MKQSLMKFPEVDLLMHEAAQSRFKNQLNQLSRVGKSSSLDASLFFPDNTV
jgi:hypothetical protein